MISDLTNLCGSDDNQTVRLSRLPESHATLRGGQKHLPANRRAKLRELRSRVRILQKAFVRTRSIACADLYRKAIRVARGDIAELEAV